MMYGRRLLFSIVVLAAAMAVLAAIPDSSDADQDAVIECAGIHYKIVSTSPAEVYVTSGNYHGDVSIPETVAVGSTVYTVAGVDGHAFADCTSLESVILPDTVKTVEDNAFHGTVSLRKLTVGPHICEGTWQIRLESKGFDFVLDSDVLQSFSGKTVTVRFGMVKMKDIPDLVREVSGWSPVFRISVSGTDTYAPIPVIITYYSGNEDAGVTCMDAEGYTLHPPSEKSGSRIRFSAESEYFFVNSDGTDQVPFSDTLALIFFLSGTAVATASVIWQTKRKERGESEEEGREG